MRRNTRALIFVPLAVVAVMVSITIGVLTGRPALRVWRLPDGSTVTVEGFIAKP